LPNVNLYTTSKDEELEDPDRIEVLKMTRFYEMVHDKKKVGMPVRLIGKEDRRAKTEAEIIEQWPLI
jgi:hypothetical protein